MRSFVRAPGVLVESLDGIWCAYSALSGETHLLNNESAAIVEALDPAQPLSAAAVCELLAQDCGLAPAEIQQTVGATWEQLIEAGLIRVKFGTDSPLQ